MGVDPRKLAAFARGGRGDYDEAKHARDTVGRFSSTGGEAATSEAAHYAPVESHEIVDSSPSGGEHAVASPVPLHRGPGPVISRDQADEFSKDSEFKQSFFRGTVRPNEGVYIPEKTSKLSLYGRGIYMVDGPNAAESASKYGDKQEVRVNVRKPLDFYGEEAKDMMYVPRTKPKPVGEWAPVEHREYKPEFKKLMDQFPHNTWEAQQRAALQVVAQRKGYDAGYYGDDKEGHMLVVFDGRKVAVVK